MRMSCCIYRRFLVELYVHIPFCARKCNYCDFLSFAAGEETKKRYIDALIRELGSNSKLLDDIDTVFIGGGTPSILSMCETERLLAALKPFTGHCGEWTVECNPGTVDEDKLKLFREYGVNRLSFGLQSADDKELERIGRIHGYRDFLRSYELARKTGFDNINIDVMSGLPGQSIESWEKTLKEVTGLEPEHISAYSLIIEPGTPFYELYGDQDGNDRVKSCDGKAVIGLPSEEEEREMYHRTLRILRKHGYDRYEISNYCKPGYECRHNLGYWKGSEYVGIGIGAASYVAHERYRNTADIDRYIRLAENDDRDGLIAARTDTESIGEDESIEEYMILRLRLTEGVDTVEFKRRFGFELEERFGDSVRTHIKNGLLSKDGDRLYLTERGMDLANTVMSDFCI